MIDLSYNESYYEYNRGNGINRNEIPDEIRVLVAACQLKRCAVCTDLIRIIKGKDDEYFNITSSSKIGWIEHLIPVTWLGEDHFINLAYTCIACNKSKSNKIFFWNIWQAFRVGETIGDFNFWKEYEDFIGHWKRQGFMNCYWPWWARDKKTGDPILFGFDGKNYDMQESFRQEYAIFRRNAYTTLKSTWWSQSAKENLISRYLSVPRLQEKALE